MPSPPDSSSTIPRLVGRAVERVEDAALLTGRGRFADDVGERPGTAHAAVLRSPHAHAEIVSLDAAAAVSTPGVVTVLTGEDVVAWSRPFIAGVKTERIRLEGDIPNPVNVPSGYRFHTRCAHAQERCRVEVPKLVEKAPGHWEACHLDTSHRAGQSSGERVSQRPRDYIRYI